LGPSTPWGAPHQTNMDPQTTLNLALAVLCLDAGLFFVTFLTVYRGVASIKYALVALISEPDSLRDIGKGFAEGMRSSQNGKAGKDKQVSDAEEKAVLGDILESWMSVNTPMIKMIEEQVPDIRKIIRKNPQAAFVIMSKYGPALEGRIQGAADGAMNAAMQGMR